LHDRTPKGPIDIVVCILDTVKGLAQASLASDLLAQTPVGATLLDAM
jgi:hypothetical protein